MEKGTIVLLGIGCVVIWLGIDFAILLGIDFAILLGSDFVILAILLGIDFFVENLQNFDLVTSPD